MRVVISGLSAPAELNGVSRHAANLVRSLLSLNDAPEVHFLTGAWQEEMYSQAIGLSDSRLHMHRVNIRHTDVARILWYYLELPRIATRLRADLVHLTFTMPLCADSFKCPIVVSLHDLYPFDIPRNFGIFKGLINRQLMAHCLRRVDAIACVSASTRHRLMRRFGATLHDKAFTIPNVVEPFPMASARRPQILRDGQAFLLCIAQHRENKNIPLALEIFARALRNRVIEADTKFLVVGIPGPDTSRIHAQISQSWLENNVVLMSGIDDAELQWCYRNCRLLLATSSIEGFGLPVAEALLAGCPVVCSDIPAFREIGGSHCRYVVFGEGVVSAYEKVIRETLTEPRRNAATMASLAASVIAGKYIALYKKLLAHRHVSEPEIVDHPSRSEEFDPADTG